MYDVTSIQNLKKDVLYLVAKASFEGTLEEERDHIPEKMIEGPEPTFRCCIYKEREIVRQRIRLAEEKLRSRRRWKYRAGDQICMCRLSNLKLCCNKQLSELSWKRLYQSMSFRSNRTRTYKIKNRFSEM